MIAGESPIAAAQRKASEEAGLGYLDPERFHYIGTFSTCFAFRNQQPIHNGSHSVNLTYQIALTKAEKDQVRLNQEYDSDWKWVEVEDVSHLLDLNNALDRALLGVIRSLAL